jgi:3-oxoacyl-[acyl-carrier protein] reductase
MNPRVAIVTGASRQAGIGAAIARGLAEQGVHVCTTFYRAYDATMPWGSQAAEADEIVADLRRREVRAVGVELDLAQPDAPAHLFDQVEAALGPVAILVNNAAVSEQGDISALDAAQLDRHYAVNVRGAALLCAEFVRRYRQRAAAHRHPGRIINMSSGQGAGPMPDELAYATTKGAVEAFSLSLSAAVASDGITVNAIDPGITDTGWIPPALQAEWTARAPMGRVGLPEDAARLVCFLASAEAGWITGQLIRSRGGM